MTKLDVELQQVELQRRMVLPTDCAMLQVVLG